MRNLSIARSPLSRLGLAIALTVGAGASQADCTQANMKGIWYATSIGTVRVDPADPNNLRDVSFTTFCKVIVNSAGAFSKTTSFCSSSVGQSAIEGTMEVLRSCAVKPFKMAVFSKTGKIIGTTKLFEHTVDYMAVNRSKDAFVATGNKDAATTFLAQFMWTGVKR